MIATTCLLLFAFLALRSLVLTIFESKPFSLRLVDLFLAAFFSGCAFLLYVFRGWDARTTTLSSLLIASIFIVLAILFLIRRLNVGYRSRPVLLFFKFLFVLFLCSIAFFVLMTTGFFYLTKDEPVVKVSMTGRYQREFVEWKQPQGNLQRQYLPAYEVILTTPEEKPVSRFFVYGDQVAIKAKVVRFKPTLNLIGIRNLCRIEYVYNGYTTAARFNSYPHRAQEVQLSSPSLRPWQDTFWKFWEKEYFQSGDNPLIKSATLESNYFPLVYPDGRPFHGSYYLTITTGGLSAVPLP